MFCAQGQKVLPQVSVIGGLACSTLPILCTPAFGPTFFQALTRYIESECTVTLQRSFNASNSAPAVVSSTRLFVA